MVVFVTTGEDSLLRLFHEELGLLLTRAKNSSCADVVIIDFGAWGRAEKKSVAAPGRESSHSHAEQHKRQPQQISGVQICSTVMSDVSKGITRIIMGHVLGRAMDF